MSVFERYHSVNNTKQLIDEENNQLIRSGSADVGKGFHETNTTLLKFIVSNPVRGLLYF